MDSQRSQAEPSSSGRAPRGSACLNCRRRKLRCDGARPICGPCIRTNRQADCEYTDGPVRSPTQVLEDNIARLEARIYELENPETITPSVTLYDPRISSSDSGMTIDPINPAMGPPLDYASGEPSLQHVQTLVGHFLPFSSQVGFFLHPRRFMESISVSHSETRIARLSPALVNSVYLWGARFSRNQLLLAQESVYLQRAVQSVSLALAEGPRHNIVYLIQAEVLLTSYFYASNRLLEGRYHCNAAVALVLSSHLNKLRSAQPPTPRSPVVVANYQLPQPVDAIEEGERINAFWTVFIQDKQWGAAAGLQSHFNGTPGAQVDTPWPLEIEDYERGGFPLAWRSSNTVHNFLTGEGLDVFGTALFALHAKAATLFERAARLMSQWTANPAYSERFATELFTLDGAIDRFIASLPPVHLHLDVDVARKLIITHTLARDATIKVQAAMKQVTGMPSDKDVVAAQAIAAMLDNTNIGGLYYVDPIVAIVWSDICRVLSAGAGRELQHIEADHNRLGVALQKVLAAMTTLANTCPLTAVQAAKVQQEMENAAR